MEMQMPKPLASRKSQPLSSLDNISNQRHSSSQDYEFTPKGWQPNDYKNQLPFSLDDRLQKENRPPTGHHQQIHPTPSHSDYHHAGYSINRSIGINHMRKATSRQPRQHPSTGGKTISSSLMKKVSQPSHSGEGSNNTSKYNENNINSDNPMDRSSTPRRHFKQKQRTEQRMSPEHLKLLCRRIDPSLPTAPHGSPSKPILPSIFTHDAAHGRLNSSDYHLSRRAHTATASSLYQTCIDLWPTEPTLGDLASDNIKNLTNLLKVRLSQAKYRILAQLDEDDHAHMDPTLARAAHVLHDDIDYSTWPSFEKHRIELSTKRSCSSPSVSGNGVHFFRQSNIYLQSRRLQQQKQQHRQDFGLISSPLADRSTTMNNHHFETRPTVSLPPPSPSAHVKTNLKRKRRVKSKPGEKPLRDDGRDRASKLSPVKLEDGSLAFVCPPCNKKYKTRNGMAYHLDRCPSQPPMDEITTHTTATTNNGQLQSNSQSPGSKSSGVHCICDHPTDDEEMMVQCDECQQWLHLNCIGENDNVLDDIYQCPRCTTGDHTSTKRPCYSTSGKQKQEDTIASLIFERLNNTKITTTQSDPPTTNQLHHLPADAATKPTAFHSQSTAPSSTNPSLWNTLDLLDGSNVHSSSSSTPTITATVTSSLNDTTNNGDTTNLWGLSTVDIPSLFYSEATTGLTSTLDDDYLPSVMDLPSSELTPGDLPPADWFQFANFDDDFHCDDS